MCVCLYESMRTAHTHTAAWEARSGHLGDWMELQEMGTRTLETGWSYRWWCFEPNPGLPQERSASYL